MSVSLPLHEMSIPEKLRIMEELWTDLSRDSDALESPDWHGAVLKEREQQIVSGEAQFTDWETAKNEIRQRMS